MGMKKLVEEIPIIHKKICSVCRQPLRISRYDPGGSIMYCDNKHYTGFGLLDECPEWGKNKRYVNPEESVRMREKMLAAL
jgi:hypothetical protein